MFDRVFNESNAFSYNLRFKSIREMDVELEDDESVNSIYEDAVRKGLVNTGSLYNQSILESGEAGLRASMFSGARSSTDAAVKRMFDSFDVTKRVGAGADTRSDELERVRELRNSFVRYLTKGERPENEELFESFDRMSKSLEYLSRSDIAAATRNAWETQSYIDQYTNQGLRASKEIINRLSERDMTFEEVQEGIRQIQNDMASSRENMDRLLQDGYYTRPGTLPMLGMIHSSNSFLDINMYQLQNRSIKDHLITTIASKASTGEPFTLRVKMAFPLNSDREKTSFDILGPNLNTLRELELLKDLYSDRPNIKIEVQTGDKGNHPKMIVNDLGYMIGSQNQTAPLGRSPFVSGSNYEVMKVVRLSEQDRRKLDGFMTTGLIKKSEYKDLSASGKMYVQARSVMNRVFDSGEKFTSTGFQNIAGPEETYDFLKGIAQGLRENRGTYIGVLDQIHLLQYDTPLMQKQMRGEMGEFLEGELSNPLFTAYREQRADKYRMEIQRPVVEAVIGGKARFVVDTKNYMALEESVYGKDGVVRSILERNQFTPEALVTRGTSGATSVTDRIINLTEYLVRETSGLGRSEAEAKAIQLLLMTSGNIEKARVPRQHVKAGVFVTNYSHSAEISQLEYEAASAAGSSNQGPWATSPGDDPDGFNRAHTNFEMNEILARHSFRSKTQKLNKGFGLTDKEEELLLREGGSTVIRMYRELRGQLDNAFSRRPSYETVVDSLEILEIEKELRALGSAAGSEGMFAPFSAGGVSTFINRDDKGRPVNIQVTVGAGIPGVRAKTFKYAPLRGVGGQPGFIFSVNEGRLINSIEFGNLGSNSINTAFGNLGKGERTTLTPRQALVSMIASMQVGAISTAMIEAPYAYFRELQQNTGAAEYAIAKYLVNKFEFGSIAPGALFDPNLVPGQAIVEKSLTNLLGRMTNATPELETVRQLAGINLTDERRRAGLNNLTATISGMALQNSASAREMLFRGATSNYGIKNVVDSLLGLINTNPEQYADLIYDIVSAQGDVRYQQTLQENIKELFTQIAADPHTVQAQANIYSATQARDKRLFYGVNDNPVKQAFARLVGEGTQSSGSLRALYGYALMLSPMEFGPTSFLGRHRHDDAKRSILYVDIAEGGSARFEPDDIDRDLMESYGNQLLPLKHSKTGDVVDLIPLMQNAGVGQYLDLDKSLVSYVGYLMASGFSEKQAQEIADMRVRSFRDLYGEDTKDILLFNFDTMKKGTQILQRLKNVKGSRPLQEGSRELFNILKKGSYTGSSVQGVSIGGPRTFYNTNDLQTSFVEGLRDQLRAQIGNRENITTVIGDELGIGALRGGDLKSFITAEQGAVLTQVKREVLEGLGIEEQAISSTLLYSVIRAKLIHLENIYSPVRGLIGTGNVDNRAITLMMFGGAASDPYFYNPAYRGGESMGVYSDRAVKGVRSSLLKGVVNANELNNLLDIQSWRFDEKLIATSGAVIRYDRGSGKSYLISTDSSGKETVLATVDSRKEFATVRDVMQRASGLNSFGYISATSSGARFADEGGMEVLREVKILPADLATNELQVELIFDRGIEDGRGGRRVEGEGGLTKAVTMTTEASFFEEILSQVNSSRASDKLILEQVQGLMSVTNFKSYRFDHGAAILADKARLSNLLSQDPRRLALATLSLVDMSGTSRAEEIYSKVYQLAKGGTSSFLNEAAALSALKTKELGGLSYQAAVGRAAVTVADNNLKVAANIPTLLKGVTPEAVLLALNSGQGDELRKQLSKVLSLSDELRVFNTVIGDEAGRAREAALIAGQLDLYSEMLSAKKVNLRLAYAEDPTTYAAMATSAGFDLDAILAEGTDKEFYQEILSEMMNSAYIARMYTPFLFSQSKVAAATKTGVRLESQHILPESFRIQSRPFVGGGSVDQVRNLFNLSISMVSGLATPQIRSRIGNLNVFQVNDPYIQGPAFRGKAIGVYAGDSLKFNFVKTEFNFYEMLVSYLSSFGGAPVDYSRVASDVAELVNSVKLAKGHRADTTKILNLTSNLNSRTMQDLRELALQGRERAYMGLKELDDSFNLLYGDKPVGIGELEASVRGLEQTGLQTMGIQLPYMEFEGTQVRVRSDVAGTTAILYSGELIRLMGEQYGGFEAELARTNISLIRALAPGSRQHELLRMVSRRMASESEFALELGESDLRLLEELSALPYTQQEQILERMAGITMQAQVGSKQSAQGNTFVAAASPLVPSGTMVGANLLDSRYGTEGLSKRLAVIKSLNIIDRRLLKKEESDIGDKLLTKKALKLHSSQIDLLNEGMSQAARITLEDLTQFSGMITQGLTAGDDPSELERLVSNKLTEVSKLSISKNAKGDRFIKELAKEELTLLDLQIQRSRVNKTNSLSRELDRKIQRRQGQDFSIIFDGLQTGSRSNLTASVAGQKIGINQALSIADLEGKLRKMSGHFDRFNIADHMKLSTGDQAGSLAQIENFIREVLIKQIINPREEELKSKYEGYFANTDEIKLNELIAEGRGDTNVHSLSGIKKALADDKEGLLARIEKLKTKARDGSTIRPEALRRITGTLSTLTDVLFIEMELSSALVRRSAPFGNPFVNENINDRLSFNGMNKIVSAAESKFGGDTKRAIPVFSEEHNRTLLLLNPFTFLISDLGDFDGDTYSVILNDINRARARLARDEQKLADYRVRANTLTEKEEKDKASIEFNISISKTYLNNLDQKHNEFKYKVAEYISQYTGTPKEFFLSKKEGGFLDKKLPVETIMAMIGGKFTGLYTIEGAYDNLHKEFGEYIKEGYRQLTERPDLTDKDSRLRFLQSVLTNPQSKSGVIGKFVEKVNKVDKKAIDSFLSLVNIGDVAALENNDWAGLGKFVGSHNRMALNDFLKYSAKGVEGAPMTPEQYQMLQAVLGQAGSVILGKTYNNLLGVYYAQAPSLAITDALLRDETLREFISDDKLEDRTKEKIRNVLGLEADATITAEQLVSLAKKTRHSSAGVSIFLQNTQQLLRDALKPPGDVSKFISGLTEKLDEFKNAKTEQERDLITERLAEDFGSGPGMKALLNFNLLNREYESLRVVKDNDLMGAYNVLSNMGLSADQIDDIAVQRLGLNGNLLAASEFGTQYRKYGSTKAYESVFGAASPYLAIAEYKTAQDLLNLSVFFSFEESKKGKLESSGVAFADIHREALKLIETKSDAGLTPEAKATRAELSREVARYSAYTTYLQDREASVSNLSRQSIYSDMVTFRADLVRAGAEERELMKFSDKDLYTDFMQTVELFNFANTKEKAGNIFEGALLGHKELTGGSSEAAKALYLTYMFKKKEQTAKFMGEKGENLINLLKFNQTREIFYSNEFAKNNSFTQLDMDSAIFAGLMAQGGGKITEENIASFFSTMIDTAKVQSGGQVGEKEVFLSVLNNPLLNSGDEHRVFRLIVEDMVNKEGMDGPFMKRYKKQMEATLFGQMHKTLAAYVNSDPHSNLDPKNRREHLREVLTNMSGIKNSQMIETYLNNVETVGVQAIADSSEEAMARYFEGNIPMSTNQSLISRAPKVSTKGNPLLDFYSPGTDVTSQALLLPMLGIVGQAIASGGITSDVMTQAVSGMLMGASYMRFSNFASPVTRPGVSKTLQGMAMSASGVGFRLNTALTQSEYTGEEVGESITKMLINEVVSNAAVALVTEPAAKFFEKRMGRLHDLNDQVDELNTIRGLTSSVMGLATGAIIGMATGYGGNLAVQEIAGYEPSVIGSFIDTVQQIHRMTSGTGMELGEIGESEPAVIDEEGNLVPFIATLAERIPQVEDESETSSLIGEETAELLFAE